MGNKNSLHAHAVRQRARKNGVKRGSTEIEKRNRQREEEYKIGMNVETVRGSEGHLPPPSGC